MNFRAFHTLINVGIGLFTGLILISCSMQKPQPFTQGIEGQILRLSGNQMPMKGRSQPKGKGFAADILVYTVTTLQQADGQMPLFNNIKTKKIAQTKSDSSGHYKLALPTGKYSVFIKFNGLFFASETDGEGNISPVVVESGRTTRRSITVNVEAAY